MAYFGVLYSAVLSGLLLSPGARHTDHLRITVNVLSATWSPQDLPFLLSFIFLPTSFLFLAEQDHLKRKESSGFNLNLANNLQGGLTGSVVKNLPANAGDTGLIPGSGRSSGEENDSPL